LDITYPDPSSVVARHADTAPGCVGGGGARTAFFREAAGCFGEVETVRCAYVLEAAVDGGGIGEVAGGEV